MVAKVLQFLKSFKEDRPDLAEDLDELCVLYEAKLWHQISLKLESLTENQGFSVDAASVKLYKGFVSDFGSHLNQLKLAQFAVKASESVGDVDSRLEFLNEILKQLKEHESFGRSTTEPMLFVEMTRIQDRLLKGEVDTCKRSIDEAKEKLEHLSNVDPIVSSKVYAVSCQLHKTLKQYGEFYKDALMYLALVSFDSIPPERKEALAVDIALAALLADDVYNFGELLLHPIVNLPKGSKHQWLQEILDVFNRGDMTRFEEMCSQHVHDIEQFPELVEKFDHVRQKITIMCLLGLIFQSPITTSSHTLASLLCYSLPAEERRIPLKTIGEHTKLDNDGVEFLLMRALSLHLIEGTIDQVDEFVQITWVQPRVLTMPELQGLYHQLSSWMTKVNAVSLELEQESFGVVEA